MSSSECTVDAAPPLPSPSLISLRLLTDGHSLLRQSVQSRGRRWLPRHSPSTWRWGSGSSQCTTTKTDRSPSPSRWTIMSRTLVALVTATDTEIALTASVTATLGTPAGIVSRTFVRCSVLAMEITIEASATAILAGRERNVRSEKTNARFLTVTAMDNAWTEHAFVTKALTG